MVLSQVQNYTNAINIILKEPGIFVKGSKNSIQKRISVSYCVNPEQNIDRNFPVLNQYG